jgi:hypothetical protein
MRGRAMGFGGPRRTTRAAVVERLAEALTREESPRALMALLVATTGAVGLLASAGLHALGLLSIWIRYLVSAAIAYLSFLFFVYLWIRYRRGDDHEEADDGGEVDSYGEDPAAVDAAEPDEGGYAAADVGGRGGGDGAGGVAFDEGVVLLVIVAAVASVVAIAGYVIVVAPSLLAELLLDGVLAAALYRRLRRSERRHWLQTAFVRTRVPMVVVVMILMFLGVFCTGYAPDATTLGEVLEVWRSRRN